MRILHTADWHVGRTIRGRSRADEHEAVLAEIAGIAAREGVDLVVVAGDQFDTAAPTPEAERIVYQALVDLADTGAEVVVVAGNHDNPNRLAAVAPLLETRRVHTATHLARPEDGGVLDVTTAGGETARLALLPFLSQRAIVRADDLMGLDADQHAQRYAGRVEGILDHLTAGFATDTINLVVGHLTVFGGTVGGGERAAHTVFDYAVPATAFPASAHYVALGHLHRAQELSAACPTWYAGAPLQLDFGETGYEPAVLVVDAEPGTPAHPRPVRLSSGRRLRTLRGSLAELEAQAADASDDEYLRLLVRDESRAGLAEQVREWFPTAVDVVVDAPARDAGDLRDTPTRLGRSPRELFAEYLEERGATDERVLALFDELWDAAHTSEEAG